MSDCAGAWYSVVVSVEEKREYRIWATDAVQARTDVVITWLDENTKQPKAGRSRSQLLYAFSRGFPVVESVTELTPEEAT